MNQPHQHGRYSALWELTDGQRLRYSAAIVVMFAGTSFTYAMPLIVRWCIGGIDTGEFAIPTSFPMLAGANHETYLIMDEATSSVDSVTESRVQAGLQHVLEGRIAFVIAHRLSTIRSANRILVIDDGRIKEQGPTISFMRCAVITMSFIVNSA